MCCSQLYVLSEALFSMETGEPSFLNFGWFCEHSANARAVLFDFGTRSIDVMF